MSSLYKTRLARGEDFLPVSLKEGERSLHLFCSGATGKGKSTLLENLIKQDCNACATVVIDPSGVLAGKAWSMKQDMYLSRTYPEVALNPMCVPNCSPYQILDLVIELINHTITATSNNEILTVHMKNILLEVITWCLENGRPRLDAVKDRLANGKVAKNLHMARDGVVSRLDSILGDPAIHRILCIEEEFDWVEFTRNKRMLILDTFGMGLEKNVFVGSTLTYLIRAYFQNTRRKTYYPLSLIVDECHHYVNTTFYDILKEGRKFKLMATLATQDFANVPEKFVHTVLSNVGTIVALSPGAIEATRIGRELNMPWESVKFVDKHHGVVSTPRFTGVCKMMRPPMIKDVPLPTYKVEKTPMWFTTN